MIRSIVSFFQRRIKRFWLYGEVFSAIDSHCRYSILDVSGQVVQSNEPFLPPMAEGSDFLAFYEEGNVFRGSEWKDVLSGECRSTTLRMKGGEQGYHELKFCPVRKRQSVAHIVVLSRDVNGERQTLQEAQAVKQAIDISHAYIKFDVKGYVTDANEVFVKTLGYTSLDDIKGKHHSLFVSKSQKESTEYRLFWEQLRSGRVQKGVFRRISKSGESVWIEAAYAPIKDAQGTVESIIKIAVDVTDEKQANDRLTDIKATIDASFGYVQFDPLGTITDLNSNFVTLLGYASQNEVVGQHHSMFVGHEVSKSSGYQDFWKELRMGRAQKGEFKRIDKSGKDIWIQAAYTPLTDANGQVVSVIKIAADITSSVRSGQENKDGFRIQILNNLNEISTAISQIAAGSRDQAIKTDTASSLIEKSLHSSTEVGNKAKSISEIASSAAMEAQVGESTVSELSRAMTRLNNVASDSELSMKHFMDNTKEVNQVLNVIKEISSQTNLLALNASIEAAQAGDYGRGFAVIAQEVRDLSENSRESAQQIEELIRNVQTNSMNVASAMREVSDQVVEGLSVVTNVTDIFKKMSESTMETSEVSANILEAAELQTAGMQDLVKSIESIVVIAEQTAAGAEEVSSASQTLEAEIGRY